MITQIQTKLKALRYSYATKTPAASYPCAGKGGNCIALQDGWSPNIKRWKINTAQNIKNTHKRTWFATWRLITPRSIYLTCCIRRPHQDKIFVARKHQCFADIMWRWSITKYWTICGASGIWACWTLDINVRIIYNLMLKFLICHYITPTFNVSPFSTNNSLINGAKWI